MTWHHYQIKFQQHQQFSQYLCCCCHFSCFRYNFTNINNDNPLADSEPLLGQYGQLGRVAELFKVGGTNLVPRWHQLGGQGLQALQTWCPGSILTKLVSGKAGWLLPGVWGTWWGVPQQQPALWTSTGMVSWLGGWSVRLILRFVLIQKITELIKKKILGWIGLQDKIRSGLLIEANPEAYAQLRQKQRKWEKTNENILNLKLFVKSHFQGPFHKCCSVKATSTNKSKIWGEFLCHAII